jgi:glycosyltransferase involved in cell wall biosynthesis
LAATRPTILQIIPSLDTGGAELSTLEITHAISESGGRALVATSGGRLASQIKVFGGEWIEFPAATKNPALMLANAIQLATLIKRENVSLIHARSRAPAWSALWAARRTGIPFITTYHGAYAETNALKRAYNSVMARGDIVIANSAYTANLIKTRYTTPDDRIRIIHRGVEPLAFNRQSITPARIKTIRESWFISPDCPVILQPARLTRWKGQTVLIDAVASLARAGRLGEARTIMAGDNQGRVAYTQELLNQIDAAGLNHRVRATGHVVDMPAAYAAASVTIIASTDPEAFGRTAIESQMMGCPVIATNIGAPPETVKAFPAYALDDRTGWLIPPGDPAALATALGEALSLSDADRQALSARAQAHAAQHFSLNAMKRATLKVYDERLQTTLASSYEAAVRANSPQIS